MTKKKVGIITFHRADNLGAVLQAFALQKTLEEKCNVVAEIIDYKCEEVESTKKVKINKSFKGIIKVLPMMIYYRIKQKGFNKFRKEFLKTSENHFTKHNIENCVNDYDIFITGSDQVWNLSCSGNDMTYFLDFVPSGNSKTSYAASIGSYKYTSEDENSVSDYLKDFNCVSVREPSACEGVEKLYGRKVSVNCDPVALLNHEEWKQLIPERLCSEKYILVYLIQDDVNVMRSALKYAKDNGCKIINNKKSLEFILHNAPAEFLSWIFYAECVFTNSFHGTMFSLIFSKPLGADVQLKGGKVNNRVKELLLESGCEYCILTEGKSDVKVPNAEKWILEEQEKSIAYLKSVCSL